MLVNTYSISTSCYQLTNLESMKCTKNWLCEFLSLWIEWSQTLCSVSQLEQHSPLSKRSRTPPCLLTFCNTPGLCPYTVCVHTPPPSLHHSLPSLSPSSLYTYLPTYLSPFLLQSFCRQREACHPAISWPISLMQAKLWSTWLPQRPSGKSTRVGPLTLIRRRWWRGGTSRFGRSCPVSPSGSTGRRCWRWSRSRGRSMNPPPPPWKEPGRGCDTQSLCSTLTCSKAGHWTTENRSRGNNRCTGVTTGAQLPLCRSWQGAHCTLSVYHLYF